MLLKAKAVSHAKVLHCYIMWCPLTVGNVASQCLSSRDAEHVIRYLRWCEITKVLGVYAVKQFYHNETSLQEFKNLIESYVIHYDINGPSNLTEMTPVIGMEGNTDAFITNKFTWC